MTLIFVLLLVVGRSSDRCLWTFQLYIVELFVCVCVCKLCIFHHLSVTSVARLEKQTAVNLNDQWHYVVVHIFQINTFLELIFRSLCKMFAIALLSLTSTETNNGYTKGEPHIQQKHAHEHESIYNNEMHWKSKCAKEPHLTVFIETHSHNGILGIQKLKGENALCALCMYSTNSHLLQEERKHRICWSR